MTHDAPETRTIRSRLRSGLMELLRLLLVLAVATTIFGRLRAPSQQGTAADFTLPDLQGQPVSLSDLRGREVVLNFWATWCGPCRAELPMLAAWARAHPEVVVLGISADRDPQAVHRLAPSLDLPYTILLDPRGTVTRDYGVTTFPTTFRLDADGHVMGSHTGLLFGPQLDLMAWW